MDKMKKKNAQIEYLKEQKKGNIEGGFAELITDTYNYLKTEIDKAENGYCNPYNNDICRAVYENTYHVPMIQKYLYKLKSLGYISIEGSGVSRKIRIVKELDF